MVYIYITATDSLVESLMRCNMKHNLKLYLYAVTNKPTFAALEMLLLFVFDSYQPRNSSCNIVYHYEVVTAVIIIFIIVYHHEVIAAVI